jgi:8-oxo-dGTP pyrophosphatase MutT (NUDIX family)
MKKVVSIAAIRDGKLLFGLRRDTGKWNLPGGHVEPSDASLRAAAERELREETGLAGTAWLELGWCDVREGLRVYSFMCEVDGKADAGSDPDEEMEAFKWLDPKKMPKSVMGNLHNKKDVTLQFLGLQDQDLDLIWDEDDGRDARAEIASLKKASLEEIMGRVQQVHAHIKTLADQGPMGHVFKHPQGGHVMTSRDARVNGGWRATRLDAQGNPTGHIEASNHHEAIKRAHEMGADVFSVQPFQKSAEQWLIKATRPQDFGQILRASTPEGRRYVDHTSQMHAHPPEHNPVVEHYENEVLKGGRMYTPKKGNAGDGITRKLIFKTEHQPQGDLFHPSANGMEAQFMVKPYHEGVVKRIQSWQKFPIQGWAEMANQALYHAGGLGHLHQKVHVSEHEMHHRGMHANAKEPALVVHMEKGMRPVYKMGSTAQGPQDRHLFDAMKIGVMDFLTNNLDRHGGNLLVETHYPQFENGEQPTAQDLPWVKRIMAIDHSRSFQYVNNHHHKWDGRAKVKKVRNLEDSMRPYLFGDARNGPTGLTRVLPSRPRTWEDKQNFLQDYAKPTFDWWAEAGPKIREAMYQQLEHIKVPEVKEHIRRNFDERAKWLDERADMGIENYGTDWYDDPVTQYHPDQKSDQEHEEEARKRAIEEYEREEAERRPKP